ncbi:MAG: nitrogenase-stabilizing/protective protein NifW, partial [Formivibrio sp.]|nr:nitrogenase-stabilizing/protective protein NifW [Formivibrio sp.]
AELSNAEDYCDFFGIDYDQAVLSSKRLAVLQRFHDLLPRNWGTLEFAELRAMFALAYSSMIDSTAREEKLFKIFKPLVIGIPLSSIGGRRKESAC